MSGIEQLKGINLGAKLTGKIAAGIYFQSNVDQTTNFGGGGLWVRIGAGNASHPPFSLMAVQPVSAPSSSGVNEYFELQGTTAPTQQLWYRYGKRAVLYASYSLSFMDIAGMAPDAGVQIAVRLVGVDTLGATSTILQSTRTTTSFVQASPVAHQFPIVAPAAQAFYLEVNNIDATAGARNLVVREAYLSIYE